MATMINAADQRHGRHGRAAAEAAKVHSIPLEQQVSDATSALRAVQRNYGQMSAVNKRDKGILAEQAAELAARQGQIEALEAANAALKLQAASVPVLEREVQRLKEREAELEALNKHRAAEIATLHASNRELRETKVQVRKRCQELEGWKLNAVEDLRTHVDTRDRLKRELRAEKASVVELRAGKEEAEGQVRAWKGRSETLERDVTRARADADSQDVLKRDSFVSLRAKQTSLFAAQVGQGRAQAALETALLTVKERDVQLAGQVYKEKILAIDLAKEAAKQQAIAGQLSEVSVHLGDIPRLESELQAADSRTELVKAELAATARVAEGLRADLTASRGEASKYASELERVTVAAAATEELLRLEEHETRTTLQEAAEHVSAMGKQLLAQTMKDAEARESALLAAKEQLQADLRAAEQQRSKLEFDTWEAQTEFERLKAVTEDTWGLKLAKTLADNDRLEVQVEELKKRYKTLQSSSSAELEATKVLLDEYRAL